MKAGEIETGKLVRYADKGFDDGYVREYEGEVIGQTTKRKTAVLWTMIRHINHETRHVKFGGHEIAAYWFIDSLTPLELL